MLSRPASYAIRAMAVLAAQPPGKLTGAREIAKAQRIPPAFLWKVLHNLARRKLIRSFKGTGGGYELARPADQITLEDIVRAADNSEDLHLAGECLLGGPMCQPERPCYLHHVWRDIRRMITDMLQQQTIADLAHEDLRKTPSPGNLIPAALVAQSLTKAHGSPRSRAAA